MSCDGFHYCKNISRVSVNHLVHGALLGRVAGKRNSDPCSKDHQNVVEPFPKDVVPPDCHLEVREKGPHFPLNASIVGDREASVGALTTLGPIDWPHFLPCSANGVHIV